MKNKLRNTLFLLALLLLPEFIFITPVQAGDPDWTIGPPNPNLLECYDKSTGDYIELPSDAFDQGGGSIFNPDLNIDVQRLERECKEYGEARGIKTGIRFVQQTRIEGYVFEFHPNPDAPGGWMASRSRDVPVVASGPGFEIVWGSEKDGLYFFDNLGAGPVTLNLRLPPDAHPINPNITVMSTSFVEVWEVDLAFYRGNYPPPNVEDIILTPDHPRGKLVAGDTIIETDEETGQITYMPNVGGVLPLNQPVAVITLAALVLIILPAAGVLTVRRKRTEN
jgi:hypothetical protein